MKSGGLQYVMLEESTCRWYRSLLGVDFWNYSLELRFSTRKDAFKLIGIIAFINEMKFPQIGF